VFVESGQPLAEKTGLDADDSIIPGVVIGAAVEDLKTEGVLFQTGGTALEGLLDDVPEEARKLLGLPQMAGGEYPFEFRMEPRSV
jgi:hypothetical protein